MKRSLKISKGFTLIELTVVITVLAVFAAAIMPNLLKESQSRQARQFFSKARNLMLEARSNSIRDGITRSVRFDEGGDRLVVERADPESDEPTEDGALALPEGITGDAYQMEKLESNSSEWNIRFYSDGKAREGGITFSSEGRLISIVVDVAGSIRQVDGPIPDAQDEVWDAGGYEQRV